MYKKIKKKNVQITIRDQLMLFCLRTLYKKRIKERNLNTLLLKLSQDSIQDSNSIFSSNTVNIPEKTAGQKSRKGGYT